MFTSKKPHPTSNEYHNICCIKSGILYVMEIVQENYYHEELTFDKTSATGNKSGLILCLKYIVNIAGKVYVVESDVCIIQGLICPRKVGIFKTTVLKYRLYRPMNFHEYEIYNYTKKKRLVMYPPYVIKQITTIMIFCIKEPYNYMSIISTYSVLHT